MSLRVNSAYLTSGKKYVVTGLVLDTVDFQPIADLCREEAALLGRTGPLSGEQVDFRRPEADPPRQRLLGWAEAGELLVEGCNLLTEARDG